MSVGFPRNGRHTGRERFRRMEGRVGGKRFRRRGEGLTLKCPAWGVPMIDVRLGARREKWL